MMALEPVEVQSPATQSPVRFIGGQIREFLADPIGYVIGAALYLLLFSVALSFLINVAKDVLGQLWALF